MSVVRSARDASLGPVGASASFVLLLLLLLPLLALVATVSMEDVQAGLGHRAFGPALRLSALSSCMSTALMVLFGTPLAWWLSAAQSRFSRVVSSLVDVPIVLPPAVIGLGLLQAFGAHAFGALWSGVPFSFAALVLAQLVVASPFYVRAATNAFRGVDPKLILVARSLGASRGEALRRVALPIALPGLVEGASLGWARALGEFGATLLFAGNLPGRTQTMPLAILSTLESDVHAALVLALMLAAISLPFALLLRRAGRRP